MPLSAQQIAALITPWVPRQPSGLTGAAALLTQNRAQAEQERRHLALEDEVARQQTEIERSALEREALARDEEERLRSTLEADKLLKAQQYMRSPAAAGVRGMFLGVSPPPITRPTPSVQEMTRPDRLTKYPVSPIGTFEPQLPRKQEPPAEEILGETLGAPPTEEEYMELGEAGTYLNEDGSLTDEAKRAGVIPEDIDGILVGMPPKIQRGLIEKMKSVPIEPGELEELKKGREIKKRQYAQISGEQEEQLEEPSAEKPAVEAELDPWTQQYQGNEAMVVGMFEDLVKGSDPNYDQKVAQQISGMSANALGVTEGDPQEAAEMLLDLYKTRMTLLAKKKKKGGKGTGQDKEWFKKFSAAERLIEKHGVRQKVMEINSLLRENAVVRGLIDSANSVDQWTAIFKKLRVSFGSRPSDVELQKIEAMSGEIDRLGLQFGRYAKEGKIPERFRKKVKATSVKIDRMYRESLYDAGEQAADIIMSARIIPFKEGQREEMAESARIQIAGKNIVAEFEGGGEKKKQEPVGDEEALLKDTQGATGVIVD